MRKFFSNKTYLVLSLISALFILFQIETDATPQVVGVILAMVVVFFSTLVLDPLRQGKFPRPEVIVFLALIYLGFLCIGIIVAATSYYQVFSPALMAAEQALFYPSAAAVLIGIFFWIGVGIIVPKYERWKY